MKEITLQKQYLIKVSVEAVFGIMTDFEKLPKDLPVAEKAGWMRW